MTTIKKSDFPALLMGAVLATGLAACSSSDNDAEVAGGAGRLCFNVAPQSSFEGTRALDEANWRNPDNYTVEVRKTNGGEVIKTINPGELGAFGPLEVTIGSYEVYAWYGVQKTADRSTFRCEGSQIVYVGSNATENVTVNCTPTCGKVKVDFSSDMATYFTDYYVVYNTPQLGSQTAAWAKDDTEPWYLLVDKAGTNVTATIHLVAKDEYQKKGAASGTEAVVEATYNLKPNKSWTLNIKPDYQTSYGSAQITIEVDETTNDKEVEITVPAEWI